MKLSVSMTERDDVVIVTVAGEVDVYTAPQLRSALEERLATGQNKIVVDLQGVAFIDSTGLGVLVGQLKALRKVDGSLFIVCSDERILRLLAITGLDQILPLHDSVDAALAAVDEDAAGPGVTV
ncbi:anti-sigma B factor antagonist [Knoellia flava TL1]|uniref:Anti-sigma factor antagonist n=2 Tax=Knoellia flava TaxID=913969 RepID=A0A8H9KTQ2_9MICO|nr:STAS domain-containing protein [Knoellia flava]KGN29519.1 anti-sigma B factor antagonist [Knoellia flava TL1]GGB75784.1 anti-sigma-B factor antagonist [Knoellia flava]